MPSDDEVLNELRRLHARIHGVERFIDILSTKLTQNQHAIEKHNRKLDLILDEIQIDAGPDLDVVDEAEIVPFKPKD